MYSSLQLAAKYAGYYFSASNGRGHGMHSPFVFDFILHVLNNGRGYEPPGNIEALRKQLLTDSTELFIEDLGAGSRTGLSKKRTVAALAASALKPPRLAKVLYRLVKHYKPAGIIELGTSLGITTAYLSSANPDAVIKSIEGSAAVAAVAKENLCKLGCGNVELITGNFDDRLAPAIQSLSAAPGLAYIDGNHRYEPTMRYFRQLLAVSDEYTILVFDDIHWSKEMEQAWNEIRQHPEVVYTVDIFFLGFVFFKREFKVKQDFTVRFR
ncbi:MAG TPA: class I SAM-dependent methyltransferase [Flavisolibacter sp.]|nr:class I SAM-dependent methyltransferase [Flavisolibacter sp.]